MQYKRETGKLPEGCPRDWVQLIETNVYRGHGWCIEVSDEIGTELYDGSRNGRINVVVGVVRDMDDIYDEIDPEYVRWLEEKVEELLKASKS